MTRFWSDHIERASEIVRMSWPWHTPQFFPRSTRAQQAFATQHDWVQPRSSHIPDDVTWHIPSICMQCRPAIWYVSGLTRLQSSQKPTRSLLRIVGMVRQQQRRPGKSLRHDTTIVTPADQYPHCACAAESHATQPCGWRQHLTELKRLPRSSAARAGSLYVASCTWAG